MMNKSGSTRREFLKGSTVAAGAAWLGASAVTRMAHAAGSDQLKIALVGCGGRGKGAAHDCLGVSENVKIVAVADAFADRAKAAAHDFNSAFKASGQADISPDRVFVGLDAYKQAINAGVDMVLLATPPGFRPQQYEAAIRAGKHVFMEKPCCTDAPGFRRLMEANKLADEKGLKVGVGLQRRHQTDYLAGIERIHAGELGPVEFLRVYWNGDTPWIRPRQPGQTEMEYQIHNWYFFVWTCGDNICEQHVHNLDIANWVMNDHPVEANGMGGRQVRKGKDVGHIFDHHFIEFTYANGTKMYSQCRHQRNTWGHVAEYVHTPKGTHGVAGGGKPRKRGHHGSLGPYQQEHADLLAAIRSGEKYNEGWHGATSSMTAVLGRMATYSGQTVRWDDAVANGPNEQPERLAFDANPQIMPDSSGSYEHAVAMPGVYRPY
jgi:myo-inositol 2-dehydrogenase / D-chiro-inositol 1-dehydrogenase